MKLRGLSNSGFQRLASIYRSSSDLKEKVTQFLKDNPNPDDATLHSWAEEMGYEVPKIEEIMYGLATESVKNGKPSGKDKIPGGLADGKPLSDFDSKQVEKGKKVEMEHTDDPEIAEEILSDHLEEFPTYYTELDKMEKGLKKDKKAISDQALERLRAWSFGPDVKDIVKENPTLFKDTDPTPTDDLPNVSPEEEGALTLNNRNGQDF